MITVAEINIAPIKSMALVPLQSINLELGGIRDDRRFYMVNGQGLLLTRRQVGKLAQLTASWDAEAELLSIRFPDGATLSGSPDLDTPAWTIVWGRRVRGRGLLGDWSDALSEFCGQPVKLMMSDLPGQVFDEFPVSLLSRASVARLSSEMGMSGDDCLATDRFRPTLLPDGCEPHQEDAWMNRTLTLADAVIRVLAPDPRCAIVNQDPITGETDADAVKSILGYRPNPLAAYFGVYGIVEKAGAVRIGDTVTPG